MKPAIIVDLDNTLCLLHGRDPYDMEHVDEDTPDEMVLWVVNNLAKNYSIIIMTGRDTRAENKTEQWLERYHVAYDDLLMRQEDDRRPAVDLKEENLLMLQEIYEILLALDDQNDIIKMYREHGIPAWQVNEDPKEEKKQQRKVKVVDILGIHHADDEEVGFVKRGGNHG